MKNERSFPATADGLAQAAAFLDEALAAAGMADAPSAGEFGIVLDELASNVVRYSGATAFTVSLEPLGGGRARLAVSDDGKPFDPLARPDPDTTLGVAERGIGGLGIFMAKKLSQSISYRRAGGRNTIEAAIGRLDDEDRHA